MASLISVQKRTGRARAGNVLTGPPNGADTLCDVAPLSRPARPLLQNGLATPVQKSRKQLKERKNRTKTIRGVKKNAGACTSGAGLRGN